MPNNIYSKKIHTMILNININFKMLKKLTFSNNSRVLSGTLIHCIITGNNSINKVISTLLMASTNNNNNNSVMAMLLLLVFFYLLGLACGANMTLFTLTDHPDDSACLDGRYYIF